MLNPQKNIRQCCLSPFRNNYPTHYLSPKSKQLSNKFNSSNKKKSLKPYRSMKFLIQSEFTRVSREVPDSPIKKNDNIAQYESIKSPINQNKSKFTAQNTLISSPIINSRRYEYTSPNKNIDCLTKAKSLTKISFSYKNSPLNSNKEQNYLNYNFNDIREQNPQNSQSLDKLNESTKIQQLKQKDLHISFIKQNKSFHQMKSELTFKSDNMGKQFCIKVSELNLAKKQEDDDLRSTMQPYLQLPKPFIGRPKSIISIQDQEQKQDLMQQSMIIDKHSSSPNILKLV